MNKKYRLISWVAVAVAVVLLVLVNLFMTVLTDKTQIKIDLTSNKRYELTDETYDYLDTYTADTVMYILASESDQDTNARAILDRYAAANSHIRIENVDIEKNPSFGRDFVAEGQTLTSNSVIVVSGDRSRIIENKEFYATEDGNITGLNVESKITTALKYVSSDTVMNAYFTTGHGETDFKGAKEALESENYNIADISTMTEDIPSDCSVLIIPRPMSDFSTAEIAKIDNYIKGGGALQVYFSGECLGLTNLYEYLKTAGIVVNDNEIVESTSNAISNGSGSYLFIINYTKNDITESLITKQQISGYLPFSKSIDALYETSGANTISSYLTSSVNSYTTTAFSQPTRDTADYIGESGIALMSENSDTGSSIYVSGTTMLLTQAVSDINSIGFGNAEYFTTLTNYMTGVGETFVVPVKTVGAEVLTMNAIVKRIMFIIIVILIPAAMLVTGIAVFFRRRNM